MMAGMLTASITSGQIISRTGKYRFFPIAGTLVMTAGLALLSRLRVETPFAIAALDMLVLGLGMGMTMQVLVLAVQNAVEYEDLGVATSGATLFRSIGGSVGTAILGAIFAARLAPATAPRPVYLAAFTHALGTTFVVAASIAALGFALTWLLEERPLRESVAASAPAVTEEIAMPQGDDALAQVARGISALARRDVQKRLIERTAARAGVDLPAAECWLLARLREDPAVDVPTLARARAIDPVRLGQALVTLQERGLVASGPAHAPTQAGLAILERLVAARNAGLRELLACWSPERHADLAEFVRRLASDDIGSAAPA
jgi:MFS family permease